MLYDIHLFFLVDMFKIEVMWRIRTSIEVVIHINGPVAEGYIFFTEGR